MRPRNAPGRRQPLYAVALMVGLLATCTGDGPPGLMTEPQAVTLSVAVFGEGRVASAALGIDCPAGAAGVCSASVETGTVVTMTAVPGSGFDFVNWTEGGRVVSWSATYSFNAASSRSLAANFSRPATVRLRAAGRVHGFHGPLPEGLRAHLLHGGARTSAVVQPDGSFEIAADVVPAGETYDLLIDVEDRPRTEHPALIRLPVGVYRDDLSILLVPMTWTIPAGKWADSTVPVSIDAAFQPVCTRPGDPDCDGFYPAFWSTVMVMWPPGSNPIPVAFDRQRSTHPVSEADSAAFWTAVGSMNEDWGMELFRPTRMEELSVRNESGTPPDRAIAVRVDNSLTALGREAQMAWWWGAGGFFYSAVVWVRTPNTLYNSNLIIHEMLHTLGFRHTCAWPTVMGSYGCPIEPRLTPHDIAYAQLGHAMAWRHREVSATHSVTAARNGERVVLLGLPPVAAQ